MTIEVMNKRHADSVLEMAKVFYLSDALDHELPVDIIEKNIHAAIDGNNMLTGYALCEDDKPIGFSFVTCYYETEVGGVCAQILDLYIDPRYQGRGYAVKYFQYIFDKYSHAKRFRLEYAKDNENALRLYKKLGFKEISYGQLSIDKI